MRILIIGFEDYSTFDNVMQKLIENSQCFIFTVICGGCKPISRQSIAEKWAINNGAPIEYIYEEDIEKLINKILKSTDYLVAQSGTYFSDWVIRKMQFLGKHGTVI